MKTKRKSILILQGLIFISLIIALHEYVFGGNRLAYYDIGSDTTQVYLSAYASIVRKLATGDFSLWDATNGFGINMNLLNLTNPFLMVAYLIGTFAGQEILPALMLPLYMIQILLAGLMGYLYLSMFRFDEKAKVLAAYMYALNGFITVWGQHYQFNSIMVLLPLELIFIERCLHDMRKWKALTVMTAVLVMNSMYLAYMSLIFSGFYVLIRLFMRHKSGFADYWFRVFRMAGFMLLGVFMSGLTLVTSFAAIWFSSSRLSTGETLMQRLFSHPYPVMYYVTLVGRMLCTSMFGISEYNGYLNYYEGPCLFFTTFFIIALVQYVVLLPRMGNEKKQIILEYAALLVGVISCLITTVGVIMDGFTFAFSRWFFMYFIYFMLITAKTLQYILKTRRVNRPVLVLTDAGLSVLYIWCLMNIPYHNKAIVATLFVTTLLMNAVLFAFASSKMEGFLAFSAVFALVIVNATVDMMGGYIGRVNVANDGAYYQTLYQNGSMDVLRMLADEDPEFYRVEKTYATLLCTDSQVQGYHSVSSYNSTRNGAITEYIDTYWSNLYFNDANHIMYAKALDNGENGWQTGFTGVKYILTDMPDFALEGYTEYMTYGQIRVLKSDTVKNIASCYSMDSPVAVDENGIKELTVSYPDRLTDVDVSFHDQGRDDSIKATVKGEEDCYLAASVPFEEGWDVYVDGVKQEMMKVNKGFIAFPVTSGSHEIEYRYTCPGLYAGAAMSAAGFAIFAAAAYISRKRRKHK